MECNISSVEQVTIVDCRLVFFQGLLQGGEVILSGVGCGPAGQRGLDHDSRVEEVLHSVRLGQQSRNDVFDGLERGVETGFPNDRAKTRTCVNESPVRQCSKGFADNRSTDAVGFDYFALGRQGVPVLQLTGCDHFRKSPEQVVSGSSSPGFAGRTQCMVCLSH